MKHVNVEVCEVTRLQYEWTCPACESKCTLDVYDNDHAVQVIKCRNCGEALFRHGPGDYGTEKP